MDKCTESNGSATHSDAPNLKDELLSSDSGLESVILEVDRIGATLRSRVPRYHSYRVSVPNTCPLSIETARVKDVRWPHSEANWLAPILQLEMWRQMAF
jgi:hypothetical protein